MHEPCKVPVVLNPEEVVHPALFKQRKSAGGSTTIIELPRHDFRDLGSMLRTPRTQWHERLNERLAKGGHSVVDLRWNLVVIMTGENARICEFTELLDQHLLADPYD